MRTKDMIPELLQRARQLLAVDDITLWLEPRYRNGWMPDSALLMDSLSLLIQQAYQQRQIVAGMVDGQHILIAPVTQDELVYGALIASGADFGEPEALLLETLAEKLAI